MSRKSQRITDTITAHYGSDNALGSFIDLTDSRLAGTEEDPQGEGYIFEYSEKFKYSTNLCNLTIDEVNELPNNKAAMKKIDDFIAGLKCNQMMYTLKTEIYSVKAKVETDFTEFKDALIAAEHTEKLLSSIMKLTRHSSSESSIQHCGFYANSYNEAFISVKIKE